MVKSTRTVDPQTVKKIRVAYIKGDNLWQIGSYYNVHTNTVIAILQNRKYPDVAYEKWVKLVQNNNKLVRVPRLVNSGWSYRKIGAVLGISKQRVGQIMKQVDKFITNYRQEAKTKLPLKSVT